MHTTSKSTRPKSSGSQPAFEPHAAALEHVEHYAGSAARHTPRGRTARGGRPSPAHTLGCSRRWVPACLRIQRGRGSGYIGCAAVTYGLNAVTAPEVLESILGVPCTSDRPHSQSLAIWVRQDWSRQLSHASRFSKILKIYVACYGYEISASCLVTLHLTLHHAQRCRLARSVGAQQAE